MRGAQLLRSGLHQRAVGNAARTGRDHLGGRSRDEIRQVVAVFPLRRGIFVAHTQVERQFPETFQSSCT